MMAGVSADPVNTCSIAFADPAYDESRFAQQVADRYRTRHFVDTVESDDFDLIDVLARTLRRALCGQLGDADLPRLPARPQARDGRACPAMAATRISPAIGAIGCMRWKSGCAARCRFPSRRPAFGLLGRMYPKADWAPRMFRAKSTFQALARDSVDAYFHSVSILRDDMRHQLFSNAFKARLAGYSAAEVFRRHAVARARDDPLRAGPVPRSEDLSGRRHQHQGRSRQHGAFARSPRAADGSSAGGVAGDACRRR